MLGTAFACLFLGIFARATPMPRQSITQLSAAQIDSFAPYTYFAAAGYCEPSATLAWTCGTNCNANSDFIPVASGGDGSDVQFWYVGYSPSLKSVVVAHQGTDPSEIEALLTDSNLVLDSLDSDLFPGISSDIQVHAGFASAQAKTSEAILAAVTTALSDNGAASVTLIGHSLGAALSLLDAMYLPLHLPNPTYRFVGYGLPRVGNQAFADHMDDTYGTQLTHVNNKQDPVPILPGRGLGYHQPSGEVHIDESNAWNSCPGQDNTNEACTVGAVPNIFVGNLGDHDGPFDSIVMSC